MRLSLRARRALEVVLLLGLWVTWKLGRYNWLSGRMTYSSFVSELLVPAFLIVACYLVVTRLLRDDEHDESAGSPAPAREWQFMGSVFWWKLVIIVGVVLLAAAYSGLRYLLHTMTGGG